MGRGRAKAKQTKVARQLKYSGGATDLDRLRSELGVNDSRRNGAEDHDLDERYAAWADQDDDDEDEEEEDDEDESPYDSHGSSNSHRAG
jgi:Protein of unknown function (DUF3073)